MPAETVATYGDLRSLLASAGLGVWRLARLWRSQIFICIIRFPSTAGFAGLCRYCEMGNVTDTGKSLASKAIGTNRGQVFELLDLGCRVPLTEKW